MSQPGDVNAVRRSDSPGSVKRKRGLADYTNSIRSQVGSVKATKLADGATSSSSLLRAASSSSGGQHYRSPDSDELQQSESGDLLHGVGSASSLTSAASSIFSHNSYAAAQNRALSHANGLTPLTNHTDSSPPKTSSPHAAHSSAGMPAPNGTHATSSLPTPHANHDVTKSHSERPSMHLPPGTARGYRAVWDPDLESRLSREERKRATVRRKEFGLETYQPNPPPDPRLAIPGYTAGNCRGKERPSKAIFRIAPYNLPQFKVDKHSVGPGEAQHVVVRGFDPFLPEATLKLNFEQFGSVASVQSKTDPATGSYLGIASIKYRDTIRSGMEVQAVLAVKQAEAEMHGHRIGLHTISVEADREGRRCKRYLESALKKAREDRERNRPPSSAPPPPPPPETSAPQSDSPAPPPNAPKGPSGRPSAAARAPPEGPRAAAASSARPGANSLIEDELVLSKIKRKPYIHIPHSSVPVLVTTIPHLKKRLKSYDWREIRLDRTGYYVVFDDSKRGEDETERCFAECNNAALFTYSMQMECQKYGNPNYERSPSPERVMQAKLKKEEIERLKREEAEDIEIEKKNRAENLDPVKGALDQLRLDLRSKIFEDIKQRVAFPILQESLDPARHTAKRRKLGLPDPLDFENRAPSLLFNKPGDTPPQTPRGRHGQHSRPLRPHDPHSHRGRRGGQREREREPTNVFLDERRRRPAPKPSHARGLHFKLQQLYPSDDDDSDDERRTSVTRDTEDQESRPLSRASRNSTPFEGSESVAETPNKRRKVADWEEEEKEVFSDEQKRQIGHLLLKEPEDLALRELETVVSTLPRSSKYAIRAKTELFIRQRTRDDDALFQVKTEKDKDKEKEKKVQVVEAAEESDVVASIPDRMALLDMDDAAITALAKKKKKSKEKIIEQQLALRARANQAKVAKKPVEQKKVIQQIEEKERELIAVEETETPREPHLSVTYDKPRRTVEDDLDVLLDIDGWQDAIKDDEDLIFAKQAVAHEIAADIGDVKFWAYKQKEIKALNTGTQGTVHSESGIDGYYVANSTGSARTEGVKKILNEEKSKYLPHRIKVQKAREERQAQAKANPTAAAEAAKVAAAEKIASTASSRSNRVNNRRLVNDINLQKQTLAATSTNTDADVAIRFNQLKKRKKHVKFERSAIHGWGLYAEENIAINDLIIEYVGEKVRQKVADMREIRYEKQGVGSSYLFRMMDDEIVDATKKGGIARFINHSCNPNCTAKIIKVEGTPRIVIYALKDIAKNEELTYDYKFEREYGSTDRIPCLCGSANCKGFLN